MKRKLCVPRILKNIAYVLFPIFMAIFIILILALTYPLERNAIKQNLSYYETNTFAEDYANEVFCALFDVNNIKDKNYGYYVYTEEIEENSKITKINYLVQYYENNVIWLIIDNETKEAYTNLSYSLETSTVEKIRNNIMKNQRYWNYQDGNIETSINRLNNDNIEYIESGLNQRTLELTE